jgi:hypothetical protein
MVWEDGKLKSANIRAAHNGICQVQGVDEDERNLLVHDRDERFDFKYYRYYLAK